MAIPADKVAAEAAEQSEAAGRRWTDHVARTTAVLAVLAAVASGAYANQFSHTILAQTEASDQWSFYQAKSIKKHVSAGQLEMERAFAAGRPELAPALAQLESGAAAATKRYEAELAEIKARAEALDAAKALHQKQGDRFQYAFVVLQAGVVLSTIAASARRKELWVGYRIAVARAARRLPLLLQAIRSGQVHLAGLRVLVPHLTAENQREVLAAAAGKSRREIEELVARLVPQPAAPTVIRRVPSQPTPTPDASSGSLFGSASSVAPVQSAPDVPSPAAVTAMIRLLCHAHNQYAAEQMYGRDFMRRARASRDPDPTLPGILSG